MVDDYQTIDINPLTLFHQNICGLRTKTDELINSVFKNFQQFCVPWDTTLNSLNSSRLI
jgi:hypothetical protein